MKMKKMFLIAVLGSTLTLPLISGAYASVSLSPGFVPDAFHHAANVILRVRDRRDGILDHISDVCDAVKSGIVIYNKLMRLGPRPFGI